MPKPMNYTITEERKYLPIQRQSYELFSGMFAGILSLDTGRTGLIFLSVIKSAVRVKGKGKSIRILRSKNLRHREEM